MYHVTNCGGAADTEANLISLMGFFKVCLLNSCIIFSVIVRFSLA